MSKPLPARTLIAELMLILGLAPLAAMVALWLWMIVDGVIRGGSQSRDVGFNALAVLMIACGVVVVLELLLTPLLLLRGKQGRGHFGTGMRMGLVFIVALAAAGVADVLIR